MKRSLIAILCLLLTMFIQAQDVQDQYVYKNALGIKPNTHKAISSKHFLKNRKAVEGIFYLSDADMRLTGLFEKYHPVGIRGLQWYYGAGAHIGFWSEYWKAMNPGKPHGATIGPDAIVGLDLKLPGVPINISLDWQPSYNIIGHGGFDGTRGGIGLRYTFRNFFSF